jgi:hypothetical protein
MSDLKCMRCDRTNPLTCEVEGCCMPQDVAAEAVGELRAGEALSRDLHAIAKAHYFIYGLDIEFPNEIPDIDGWDTDAPVGWAKDEQDFAHWLAKVNDVELVEGAPPADVQILDSTETHVVQELLSKITPTTVAGATRTIELDDDEWNLIREALHDAMRYAHSTAAEVGHKRARETIHQYMNELIALRDRFFPLNDRRSA